jgi:hypothetical protein
MNFMGTAPKCSLHNSMDAKKFKVGFDVLLF